MFTSQEKSRQLALVFLNAPPPGTQGEGNRLERRLSNQQVRLHIPDRNSELITCRRHSGQMGGRELQGRSQTCSPGSC